MCYGDIDLAHIELVEPLETFLDPLGYELSDNVAIGYINLLLNSKKDQTKYRFGTYEGITQSAHQEYLEKTSHKNIETIMKKVVTKAGMTKNESQVVR